MTRAIAQMGIGNVELDCLMAHSSDFQCYTVALVALYKQIVVVIVIVIVVVVIVVIAMYTKKKTQLSQSECILFFQEALVSVLVLNAAFVRC